MLRPGSAGANTTADHLQVLEEAITAVPAKYRRRLMVTCDGAGASHGLITRLDELASRPGRQLIYSIGWGLGVRESPPSPNKPGRSPSTRAAGSGPGARTGAARIFPASMHDAGARKRTPPS